VRQLVRSTLSIWQNNIEMSNSVSWNVTPCDSCNNRSLGGTYHLHYQDDKSRRARNSVASYY
jgi:hypothetical protein